MVTDGPLCANTNLQLHLNSQDAKLDQISVAISEETSVEENSDLEENYNDDVLRENGWVADTKPFKQIKLGGNDGIVLPEVDVPQFGDVCIKHSENVHLGNKTFYKGPVVIKQYVYDGPPYLPSVKNLDNEQNKNENVEKENKQDNIEITKDSDKWLWNIKIFISIIAVVVSIITILLTFILIDRYKDLPKEEYVQSNASTAFTNIDGVKFVTKDQWTAQTAKPLENLTLPVPYVMISHTVSNYCETQAECSSIVKLIQTAHMRKSWADIGYSFLVGGDGLVYVGRSWEKIGGHTIGYNYNSIGIAFIGTFSFMEPNALQLKAAQKLIEFGVKHGKIATNYKLLAQCQVGNSESPGKMLYDILKTWPHWSLNP